MLLTKDGTPYKTLFSPNPLLKDQNSMDSNSLVFHNFKWKPIIIQAAIKSKPIEKKIGPLPPKSEFLEEFKETIKKEAAAIKKEIPPVRQEIANEILVHCKPVVTQEVHDDFYGETRKTITYGNKYTFEALLVDGNDLEISLFTKQSIPIGSVIMPSKYKTGEKLEFRWWKIVRSNPHNDGFIIFGQITESQWDFSD